MKFIMIVNIYLWRNKVTNKIYIGKTNDCESRYKWFLKWDEHYAGPHIDRARKKFNDIKYWTYEILYTKEGESRELLNEEINEMEKYYINLYQSNNKEIGYNISSGGTYGDTWYALTDEERYQRNQKRLNTMKEKGYKMMNNGSEQRKIEKSKQQEYLDNSWVYGCLPSYGEKLSKSFRNSEKVKAAQAKRRLSPEQKQQRKEEELQKLFEYRQTQEYKDKIDKWKEDARQRRIEYNKSKKHRQATIESNKRRWKDGCPEETRKKMRESRKQYFEKKQEIIWISNGIESKMIPTVEIEKYIADGWHKGRK